MGKASKRWRSGILAAAAIPLVIQFIRPKLHNSPSQAEVLVPPTVRELLRKGCYDCHSNETRLTWFDQIAPAYWVVVNDVRRARTHLNFSEIGVQPAAMQKATLFEGLNQLQLGSMPLPSYKRLHPGAVLKVSEIELLKDYLRATSLSMKTSAGEMSAAQKEYDTWLQAEGKEPSVQQSVNGIPFLPEYKHWRAISSTERFDNNSLRVILGNGVTVQAIRAGHTKPWPDGAAFAKVAWKQQRDGSGVVSTGAFQQVEFMIKDRSKYASTKGWGWARWRGTPLKPYGKDAGFTGECVSCHLPLRDSDFVFTIPTARLSAGVNPMEWQVLSSEVDKKRLTMSTLFGTDSAVLHARSSGPHMYPAGSKLALVTWKQREDPHWFGGQIPSAPQRIEFVTVDEDAQHNRQYRYSLYEGVPLKPASDLSGSTPNQRAQEIMSRRASVMP